MSFKTLVASRFIEEFNGQLSKIALARLMFERNPLVFKDVEDARSFIRKMTGTHGNNSVKKPIKWNIPEAEDEGVFEYMMPMGSSPLLILNDIHFPYHDVKSLEKALNHGIKMNPKGILLNGDALDCYKLSRFEQDPSKRNFGEELDYFEVFLLELKKNFSCPIYFKIGNHEDRYMRLIKAHPQLLMIDDFSEDNVFRLRKNNINLIKSMEKVVCGKFNIFHGHEIRGGAGNQPAKWLFDRIGTSGACGHFHRTDTFYAKTDRKIVVGSMGCLSTLRPDYMPHQRYTLQHNHGFAELHFDADHFEFINHRL